MSTAYAIRVDIIGDMDTYGRMERFLSVFDKYLVYEEVADETKKLHLQGIIWTDRSDSAIRTRWTEHYPSDPWEAKYAKKKSCAKVREDSYEIYITKDGNLKYNKNYTEEEIKLLQEKSYKKEDKKEKKKNTIFFEIVMEKWNESRMKDKLKGGRGDRDDIIKWLLKEFHGLRKLWDTPILIRYANYLEYDADPDRHVKSILAACRDRY